MKKYIPTFYYLVSRALVAFLSLFPGYSRREPSAVAVPPVIVIEAGERGWTSIELKELYKSATEYFPDGSVLRLVVDRNKSYLSQVNNLIQENPGITHYLYDPRTGRSEEQQNFWNALTDSISIAIVLDRYRITPITFLTDIGYRYWRSQAAAVTATSGVVVSFLSNKYSRAVFPHGRLIGPSLSPMSQTTFLYLESLRERLESERRIDEKVRFIGSLYEPRASFFREFETLMGDKADIRGRRLGSARKTDSEYWESIASARLVITTADQFDQPGADLNNFQHMVYRYLEVLASGSLLLAPDVPGILNYFTPGIHFVAFGSVGEAADKATYYLSAPSEADQISRQGHMRAKALVESRAFWLQINSALGPVGFF